MLSYYKFYFSPNKETYQNVAKKYGVPPYRVYLLAHGKKVENKKDWKILQELKKQNIVKKKGHIRY